MLLYGSMKVMSRVFYFYNQESGSGNTDFGILGNHPQKDEHIAITGLLNFNINSSDFRYLTRRLSRVIISGIVTLYYTILL